MKPNLILGIALLVGGLPSAHNQTQPSPMTSRPNIIYILADDMGYGDVSSLNPDSKIRTTHIDRVAENGMIYRDAHSSSAVCTPSRYSILTGRYNWAPGSSKASHTGIPGRSSRTAARRSHRS